MWHALNLCESFLRHRVFRDGVIVVLNSQIKLSPYLCTGLETGLLEPQQSQHIFPGGLGLQGLVDDVPQDHRQSCPAEHPALVQHGWQSAASHQQRRVLQQNTGHIQGLRDVVFQ